VSCPRNTFTNDPAIFEFKYAFEPLEIPLTPFKKGGIFSPFCEGDRGDL